MNENDPSMKCGIIDFHVHRYPEEVMKDPILWAMDKEEQHWLNVIVPSWSKGYSSPPIQGWAGREKMVRDMHAAGIQKAVLQGWYWENQTTCIWHNAWHAKWIQEDPNYFLAFASVQPRAGLSILDDLEYAYDHGFCGIGEIFPAAQGFSMDDPVWLKVVEWAIEKDWPVCMHVTEPLGHDYPGKKRVDLMDYQWLAEKYPELTLILAHWGGLIPCYELNRQCKKIFKNVYYDTAASPLLYEKSIYRVMMDIIGSDKILFGSDYPLKLYPKMQSEPDFLTFIQDIRSAGLSEDECYSLMRGNAERILFKAGRVNLL